MGMPSIVDCPKGVYICYARSFIPAIYSKCKRNKGPKIQEQESEGAESIKGEERAKKKKTTKAKEPMQPKPYNNKKRCFCLTNARQILD